MQDLGDNIDEYLSSFLDKPSKSVCPIFKEMNNEIIQFASGVFIQIDSEVFLLTASHVMDEIESHSFWIPGKDELIQLLGSYSQIRLPKSGDREEDKIDIAYMKLDSNVYMNIHREFVILNAEDCDTKDTTAKGDAYTVIGYPASKGDSNKNILTSEITSLTGEGQHHTQYSNFKLSVENHIIVRFGRKKGVNFSTGEKVRIPKTEGMSGGGVFSWSKRLPDISSISVPKLCGIFHEYHKSSHFFVATRLHCFIECILKNNPELSVNRTQSIFRAREQSFSLSSTEKQQLLSAVQKHLKRKRQNNNKPK